MYNYLKILAFPYGNGIARAPHRILLFPRNSNLSISLLQQNNTRLILNYYLKNLRGLFPPSENRNKPISFKRLRFMHFQQAY